MNDVYLSGLFFGALFGMALSEALLQRAWWRVPFIVAYASLAFAYWVQVVQA